MALSRSVTLTFKVLILGVLLVTLPFFAKTASTQDKTPMTSDITLAESELATLGGGCFWCTEAVFQSLKGVKSVVSGYAGGSPETATYDHVSSGSSGHAEVIQIAFDPTIISFSTLLEVFFHTHDPTTLDRQGADTGPQYRSVIFYSSPAQQDAAKAVIQKVSDQKLWADPIVTEVAPFKAFFPAEDYHQDYYSQNRSKPYCSIVIAPKLQKLYKDFKHLLNQPPA